MKKRNPILATILVATLLPVALQAVVYTYTSTDQIDDVRIWAFAPDTNYATLDTAPLRLGTNPANALMSFDLSDITLAPGESVASAELKLWTSLSTGTSFTFDVHQSLKPWTETEATWNSYSSGNSWNSPGMASGTDYAVASALAAGEMAPTITKNTYTTLILDPSLVEGWINGSINNYGLSIVGQSYASSGNFGQINISSSENTIVLDGIGPVRPILTVTTVPEPGTVVLGMGLLAMAFAILNRRRKGMSL